MEEEINGHQVSTNGRTVWVNHPRVGAVGRVSPTGVDVHNAENTNCLDCGGPEKGDLWTRFVEGLRRHYEVEVPEKFKPAWAYRKGPSQ